MIFLADDQLRAHLAVALRRHVRMLRGDGVKPTSDLLRLEAELSRVFRSDPECAENAPAVADRDDDSVELVGVPEAARRLSVSVATVRRRIRLGELPVVRIGRAVRVPAAAIKEYGSAR